ISRRTLLLDDLRAVVLDEADEMLNLGFREELETILEACPEGRRTLMFSATVGGGIGKLAARYQNDALRISVTGPAQQHSDIAYQAMVTAQHDGERVIINTLRFHEAENAIVFCSTRAAVARLTSRLANRGFSVVSLSGELSQQERTNALQAMRDGRARVCVATDVAARGIDLPGLELVIHADLPKNREGLLHRSGRTGRAGRKGTSVLIVPPRARSRVERLLGDAKVRADWVTPPGANEVRAKDDERLMAELASVDLGEPSAVAKTIAETYSADYLAAAIVRMHEAGRSAPEELSEVHDISAPRDRKVRAEIEDAVWVTLSVGRSKRAEARWLLPMLCKAGPMKKSAIGAIRVREDQTYVQLDSEGASEFLSRIGQGAAIEDGIEVRLADGPPGPEERKADTKPNRDFQPSYNKSFSRDKSSSGQTGQRSKPKRHSESAARQIGDGGDAPAKLKRTPKKAGKPPAKGKFKRSANGAGANPHSEARGGIKSEGKRTK
ncbi:MAG: DEAD/DEAH box helicase, partial [Parvularcula sp.]|nr:DEAD/DEAH box helicase [Parvularcula sp.]